MASKDKEQVLKIDFKQKLEQYCTLRKHGYQSVNFVFFVRQEHISETGILLMSS